MKQEIEYNNAECKKHSHTRLLKNLQNYTYNHFLQDNFSHFFLMKYVII